MIGTRALTIAVLLLAAGPQVAHAETTTGGCPTYALKDLVRQSDLIVVGRPFGDEATPRWVTVDSIEKGRAPHRTIPITFDTSMEDCSGIEGRSQTHRFYLKRPRGRGAAYKLLLAVPLS